MHGKLSARFIPASLQIGQRIFHQNRHRSYTRHIPDKACATFRARPEEAANRVQQRVSSVRYQQVLKLHPKCAYKIIYHVLIKRDNKLSPDYLATFKTPRPHGRGSKSNR